MHSAENRSVPPNTLLPHIFYRDLPRAVIWLGEIFGFTEHYHYGEPMSGAQLYLGNAWIMATQANTQQLAPSQLGYGTQSLTIFVRDVDAHFEHARAAGAAISETPRETVYGEFQYGVHDLDGHHWLFTRHARDLDPAEWGAAVANSSSRLAQLPRPRLCYLEIPALEAARSASFYENVFGWNIRGRESARPSFDDATGNVSGSWVTGRQAAPDARLLPYIWVDDIHATVERVKTQLGELVEAPHPDEPGGSCMVATFRDVAGNLIGLYQE